MAQPAGLDAILAATGLSRSKAYRSLRVLEDAGFVDHVGRAGYRVGSRSLALATLVGPRPALLVAARPVLRWLADVGSASVTLNLRSGSHRVLVLGAEARDRPASDRFNIGERAPLTSGASGLSILAHLPVDEAETIIAGRPPRTRRPSAPRLAEIRDQGYAITFSSNHRGISGISTALLAPADGHPLGSLSLGGAAKRFPEATLRQLGPPLRKAAKELAPDLARLLGPDSRGRLEALDVTIQDFVDE